MSEELDSPAVCAINQDLFSNSQDLSYECMIELVEQKIQNLLTFEEFTSANVTSELKFIQRQTRYSFDVVLQRRIVERIVRAGIAHVYLRAWKSLIVVDYIDDDVTFCNLQTVLSIVWNCSDKSISLCDSLARASVVNQLLSELSQCHLSETDLSTNFKCLYLVKAYLGILHNMVRLCVDSRQIFRAAGAVNTLKTYLCRPQGIVRTKAFLILSYVVDERENDVINATQENIAYMVEILHSAVNSENHFSEKFAFWASEIVCGLNHLAVNDCNKERLSRLGAVELYTELLSQGNSEEKGLAAAGLWIMSFASTTRQVIVNTPGCVAALQKATTSGNDESLCRSARGALWVIQSSPQDISVLSNPSVDCDSDVPHIMISYHWGSQRTMISVRDRLKAEGYKVWMDIDNMSGSTLEAMALAVEKSAVVLICLSQGYKDSPSCRTEAEYTYRLRKGIIPLVLQHNYVPDGWLGILVGTKLFFDISSDENLDIELSRLVREIGNRGRLSAPAIQTKLQQQMPTPLDTGSNSSHQTVLHSYKVSVSDVVGWSNVDVLHWLHSVHLDQLRDKFVEFDGRLLLQYKKVMQTAPEYFYHSLEQQFHLNVTDSLLFSHALESLH